MGVKVNKLTNANVYINGANYLGRAEEIELPTIKQKMIEHKALGLSGEVELPSTGIEKMEAKIKFSSLYVDVIKAFGNPHKPIQLQAMSSLESVENGARTSEAPVEAIMTAIPKTLPLGSFKPNEKIEFEMELSVTYVKLIVDGKELVEADPINCIHKVNGVDLLKTYRKNLGID